jgi:hypothetical protein
MERLSSCHVLTVAVNGSSSEEGETVCKGTWKYVRFEGFTAVIMKNGVFWDVTPCGSCKNRRFGGTYRLLHQGDKNL